MTKKKSSVITKFLRNAYASIPTPRNSACFTKLQSEIRERFGELVPIPVIRAYFTEKDYRERHAHTLSQRKIKSATDIRALNVAWENCRGICPPRNSEETEKILQSTQLNYSDIQQWFGQKKFINKKRILNQVKNNSALEEDTNVCFLGVNSWGSYSPDRVIYSGLGSQTTGTLG
jgi:hypothetical protein